MNISHVFSVCDRHTACPYPGRILVRPYYEIWIAFTFFVQSALLAGSLDTTFLFWFYSNHSCVTTIHENFLVVPVDYVALLLINMGSPFPDHFLHNMFTFAVEGASMGYGYVL